MGASINYVDMKNLKETLKNTVKIPFPAPEGFNGYSHYDKGLLC